MKKKSTKKSCTIDEREVLTVLKACRSALETPRDLTQEDINYLIEDCDIVITKIEGE
jgi:hypothetical protein